VLLFAFFALCVFVMLPKPGMQLGRAFLFFMFGSHVANSLESSSSGSGADILRYVDPLIGTTNGGHVFPGASLPYGKVSHISCYERRLDI
jgi:putative alpha-1,2-mannosidase